MLAPITVVTLKTFAKTSSVIAKATAGTVSTLLITVSSQNIEARWTFFLRTIRTAVSNIAFASHMFFGVPWSAVDCASIGGKCFLCHANSTSRTIVGANGSFTCLSIIIFKTSAFTSISVTKSLVAAFHFGVCIIGTDWSTRPSSSLGTRPQRTIVTCPSRIIIGTIITCTFIYKIKNRKQCNQS